MTKDQIKGAIVIAVAITICIIIQTLYIRIKQDEKTIEGYERRADRATKVIDSLEATNVQRMLQIEELSEELERNKERYEANIQKESTTIIDGKGEIEAITSRIED